MPGRLGLNGGSKGITASAVVRTQPFVLLLLSAALPGHGVALSGATTAGGRVVSPRGFGAATGPAWIRSRSPAVIGARLQRGRQVASVAPQVLQPVQPPLQFDDHTAQLRGLELGDAQLLLGLGSDGGTLADLDFGDLHLTLQVQDPPVEVHDPSPDVLRDARSWRFGRVVSTSWSSRGSPVW